MYTCAYILGDTSCNITCQQWYAETKVTCCIVFGVLCIVAYVVSMCLVRRFVAHYIPCFVVSGNKADLESSRAVTADEATAYANENNLFFMETSAKTAANVNELFTEIARKLPKAEAPRQQQQPGIVLDAQPQPQAARKISSCC